MAERLPEFNTPGAPTATVDPSVGTDPSSPSQSAAPQQDPSATSAGAPAAPAGSPGEGAAGAPGSPPAQPPATPVPQQLAEGQPPQAPSQPLEGQQPAAPAQPPAGEEEEELTDEEYQELTAKLREELAGPYEEKLRTQQAGQDRAMSAVQQSLDATTARLDQMTEEMREGKLKGLSPEEQTTLRKAWDLDDREKKLNEYEESLKSFHGDTDVLALLNEYGQFGVTERELQDAPVDERELFCEQKRAEYWENRAKGSQANGQPAASQQPAPAPQQPVPAGASAPSDTGGGGSVPPQPEPNKDQGLDAMADNIGQGWEPASFPARRG